jgi:xanthine dehydrogenase accessory factor
MRDVFEAARCALIAGERAVLASVVGTRGSTPQKPGARLLVREDGSIVGTLGGGCVEADVRLEARRTIELGGGRPAIRRFSLTEDIAYRDGLVCGGSMDIHLAPLEADAWLSLVDEIVAAHDSRGGIAIALRYGTSALAANRYIDLEAGVDPDRPQRGALLVIRERAGPDLVQSRAMGRLEGTLGDPAVDARAVEEALRILPRGGESAFDAPDGSRVFVDAFTTPPTVVIAGGGHVGRAIYTLSIFLGFQVVIIDDREEFANRDRFPAAQRWIVDDFDRGIERLAPGPNHHIVVATRGHKLDDAALLAAARSDAGYVGLLGSRRKAVIILRELLRRGVSEERVRSIRAPIGLDLGGRRPEDIALSILAEIVALRHGRGASPLSMVDDRLTGKLAFSIAPPSGRSTKGAGAGDGDGDGDGGGDGGGDGDGDGGRDGDGDGDGDPAL